MEFKQKKLITSQEFDILEDGVKITQKGFGKYVEFVVPFEEIGDKMYIETVGKNGWLIAALVTMAMFIFSLLSNITNIQENIANLIFWLGLSGFFTMCYFLTRLNSIYLVGDRNIEFMRNVPNDKEIEGFIKEIIRFRNEYLRRKYANIDIDLPPEPQLIMIKRLKDMNVISEQEFEERKKALLKGSKNTIGFGSDT